MAAAFAHPLVHRALQVAVSDHPLTAAQVGLDVACRLPPMTEQMSHEVLLDQVLCRLADWAESAAPVELAELPQVCNRWHTIRPDCPTIKRIQSRCAAATATAAEASNPFT